MIRRIRPIAYASLLALSGVHCGGSSTPESSTPDQMQGEPSYGDPATDPSAGQLETGAPGAGMEEGHTMGSERMPTAGRDEPGANDRATASMALSDPQIVAVMSLVHNAEIEQAQLAQTKSTHPQVLSFARMMIEQHSQARQKHSELGVGSAMSSLSQQLAQHGQQTLATLRDKNDADFDRAYLQAQIEQHQRVLDTLDQTLLPSCDDARLRQYLQEMRSKIAQHLQLAENAQQGLNTSGSNPSGQKPGGSTGMPHHMGNAPPQR